ncbi:phage tail terminator protein [Vreelandella sp. EE22]
MQDYDITPLIIERLKAQCPGFAYVDEAWFSKPVDDYDKDTPAALVYIGEDAGAAPSELNGRQAVTTTYGVFIVCERGDTFRAQRHEVREALFGWQPPGTNGVMAYHGGEMAEIRGRYVWWREFWKVVTPTALQAARPRTMTV